MSCERLKQWRQADFRAYKRWLNCWDWEWFITLTLHHYDCRQEAETMLRNLTRQLCIEEHIQVGYFYVYCEKDKQAHMHILMLGRNSTGDKTLADVSRSKWERRWRRIADIQIPESNYDVAHYMALHLFRFKCSNYPSIEFYNKKLLDRTQRPDRA